MSLIDVPHDTRMLILCAWLAGVSVAMIAPAIPVHWRYVIAFVCGVVQLAIAFQL